MSIQTEVSKKIHEYLAWNDITEDDESYPKCFQTVEVIEEDAGRNIAYCDPNYDWYVIVNEDTYKITDVKVVRWRNLID